MRREGDDAGESRRRGGLGSTRFSQRNMETRRMAEDPEGELGRTSDASSLSRSGSIRKSFNLLNEKRFVRNTSMDGSSRTGSWPKGSAILSHGGSSSVIEGISSEVDLQMGDGGGRAARDETVRSRSRQVSIGRTSSRGSLGSGSISLSRNVSNRILDSINFSRSLSDKILGGVDGSLVAQAGDSGDRIVVDDKEDDNESLVFFMEVKNGVSTLPEDTIILSNGLQSCSTNTSSIVSPLAEEIVSPLPTDAILQFSEKNQMKLMQSSSLKDKQEKLPQSLDYMSYMIHLAVFGELGVFTRYLLQRLFGPSLLSLTGDQTPLYLDLPANMLGSFLMGWIGVVFKGDIRHLLSDHIVVGLTTGYLGSLTTFSGWNQKMLNLSSEGHWVFAVAGIILGILLVNESIRVGVESAVALRRSLVGRFNQNSGRIATSLECWRVNSRERMIIMLLIQVAIWGLSGALARTKLDSVTNGAVLWLGCLVGPPGVWGRWYLARLNGLGLGRKRLLKWLPIGTLLANVIAACIMAALATISKAVNTKRFAIIVSGVQFGFLGCLSTVSTFVAEVYAMRQSGHSGRALAYTAATIILSFAMGTLIYSVPVWTKHYE